MESFQKTSHDRTGVAPGYFNWVDRACMNRAIELSWNAAGLTFPNPMVGAVVVSRGEIVGEGFHPRCGEAHAEVVALDRAGDKSRGATLYVSLEPCAHYGRTPPCVDRIISSGVVRVVIPTVDPDEKVRGTGVKKLRAAGIKVQTGCLDLAAIATNLDYYKHRLLMGPTVILKMATTLDGKIASAPGRRDRITGETSSQHVHRMRANSDGIVVGIGTVRVDDPILDCRKTECGDPPVPVVLDGNLSLNAGNRWSGEGRPFVVAALDPLDHNKRSAIESAGGRVLACRAGADGRIDPEDLVARLSEKGFTRLLVEGGAAVFGSFLRAGMWDAMFLFQSPRVFGGDGVDVVAGADLSVDAVAVDAKQLENDFLYRYLNRTVAAEIRSRLRPASGE
jgi:diaminohydroxyphosphoribosylaminopyrimidine deaminase/5-amino-6-(5-phosphoribosylamino)uracil reductase